MIWPLQVLVSAAVAALLAVSAFAGTGVTALAVATLVVGVALGWPGLLRLPHPRGTTLVVVVSGVAAAVAAALSVDEAHPLAPLVALAALSVPLAFVHELMRRDGRARLVESVTGTFAGQAVALLACGWVLLPESAANQDAVVVGVSAIVAARLASALPRAVPLVSWVGAVLAPIAAAAVTVGATDLKVGVGAVIGLIVGAVVVTADRLLGGDAAGARGGGALGALAASLAPVAAAGTAVYAVARLLVTV